MRTQLKLNIKDVSACAARPQLSFHSQRLAGIIPQIGMKLKARAQRLAALTLEDFNYTELYTSSSNHPQMNWTAPSSRAYIGHVRIGSMPYNIGAY